MANKDIGTLRTRLSWEDDGANRSLEGFKRDLKGLRSEMKTVTSQGKDYTNSLKGMREQQDILSRQFKTQQERVKELRKRYEESAKVKGEDAVQTKELSSQYNNAVAQMNNMEQQLKRVTSAIDEQSNPWKNLSRDLENAGSKMQTVGEGLSDFGKSYSMRVTAPIVASGTAVFKAAMDWESAFAGVAKTFSGTEEELQALSVGIRDMAKEIPASTTEIAAVAEAAGQLGIKAENIEEFTRTMMDLGEATNLTAEQGATEFARFANIVGMSQDDFDRLGSSIVALGNSTATTEAEISSMALRLAAQGSQVGMTEAQILALSASMSSLGIEAESGGTSLTTVLKKIDSAVGESGKELDLFAKAARMSSSEFAKVWENEPIKALDMFIKGLAESSSEGANLTSILGDLGIKGIRESDTMLRLAGASDLLTEAVNTSTNAWKENSALSDEAAQRYATTESELRIMWNRIKDVAISLGGALAPAVMDAIDAAEPFFKQIESGAKAFAELDEEQQQTILKLVGIVAAVGPASMALGGITSTVGGLTKGLSSVVGLLGKAGGKGLLGGIGALGMAGPVGLAVAGVGALGYGIYTLAQEGNKLNEVNWELVNSLQEEVNAADNLIGEYQKLEIQNRLTKDEMLRYMDILTELKNAKSEEAIAKLKEEQARLEEQSGLTKEEIARFIEINEEIIKQTPNTVQAISEQGNAIVENLEAYKALNEEKRRELLLTAERELEKALENETEHLRQQESLMQEISSLDKEIEKTRQARIANTQDLNSAEQELKSIQEEIKQLEQDGTAESNLKLVSLQAQLREQTGIVSGLEAEQEHLEKTHDKLLEKLQTAGDNLQTTRDEIREIDNLKGDYEELILAQVELTSEKGQGLSVLNNQLNSIRDQKTELKNLINAGGPLTQEYQEQLNRLEEQETKLENAKRKLEEINAVAGKTIYQTIRQTVETHYGAVTGIAPHLRNARRLPTYAAGTDNPGGMAIVGGTIK